MEFVFNSTYLQKHFTNHVRLCQAYKRLLQSLNQDPVAEYAPSSSKASTHGPTTGGDGLCAGFAHGAETDDTGLRITRI